MKAIEIKNLTKSYGEVTAVKDLSIEIQKGECFGFIGPNGAGKSTTIRCIMKMINKNSGNILVAGEEINKKEESYKEKIGYLPSEVHLYEDLTVDKMIAYSAQFYKKNSKKRIEELIRRLQVDRKKKIDELSLGNLKKVGIILALLHEPEILILDEATSGLDPLMQEEFFKILHEEKEKGTTIFFSSHNLSELKRICDRVGIIKQGKLIKVENIKKMEENVSLVTVISKNISKIKKEIVAKDIILEEEGKIKFLYYQNSVCLLQLLNEWKVEKVWIEEPSIEELFMHYYQ